MSEPSVGRAFRARLAPGAFILVASIFIAALRVAPARARAAAANGNGTPSVALDAPHVSAFLAAVRGTGPVACELAARSVDGRGNGFGHGGDGAATADSAVRSIASSVVESTADVAAVPVLRAALADTDACVRRLAAPLLGRVDDASAVTALLSALRDASTPTRRAGALGLAFVGKRRAGDARSPLVTALGDDDAGVRTATAWALGRLELPGTALPLAAVLRDRDAGVRRAVAYALGAIEDAAAVPSLAVSLRDDGDAGVRMAAAWALGQIK